MGRIDEKIYSTQEVARIIGVHPNTVRLYESWGFISRPRRLGNNYRVFTEAHLYQMKLARMALPGPYPISGKIVQQLVREFAAGHIYVSLALAREYLAGVETEMRRALNARAILDEWFAKRSGDQKEVLLKGRKATARHVGITENALRTWERNGLFSIVRDDLGVLCFSVWDIEKIEVIRLLRNCGYSISSLRRVFNQSEDIRAKPSTLLDLPEDDEDFFYVTNRFMLFLEEHVQRAGSIIETIQNRPSFYDCL